MTLSSDPLRALRALLDGAHAQYEILPHEMTYHSAEDGLAHGVGTLEQMAPTFILETERGYLAAIVSGATRLSYKKIKKRLGLKNVSLAKPEVVRELTGSEVGTVSLVQGDATTIVDERLARERDGFGGCGVPRHRLRIRISDLIRVTGADVFDFTEPKKGQ